MNHSLDDMYRDIILDHYRSPRGKAPVPHPQISSNGMNPSCGDEITMAAEVSDGTLTRVHVHCRGCAISVASGSMLAEVLKGKSLTEAKVIAEDVRRMLKGEDCGRIDELGDLDALKGVRKFPVRIKCALLAWMTFMAGIKEYEAGSSKQVKVSTEEDKE